jgi:hypothetical protein
MISSYRKYSWVVEQLFIYLKDVATYVRNVFSKNSQYCIFDKKNCIHIEIEMFYFSRCKIVVVYESVGVHMKERET